MEKREEQDMGQGKNKEEIRGHKRIERSSAKLQEPMMFIVQGNLG